MQSLSLPGRLRRRRRRALARDFGLRRAARLARARREDDARDDRLGDADVVIQPVLERGPDHAVDRRDQLGVVQPILRLPLELRLLRRRRSATPVSPSRMSSAASVTPFGDRLCVSMKLRTALPMPGAQAVFVRAAGAGRDAVDVRPDVLVGRLGPLQHEIEPQALRPWSA